MRLAATIFAVLFALAPPAMAEVARADLARVGVHAPPGARAPLDSMFRDQDGRALTLGVAKGEGPALLVFTDYRCTTLCGPALSIVAARIAKAGLHPGADFRLIAIGLNPKATTQDAKAMWAARLSGDPALLKASSFLSGSPQAIATTTAALGYGYAYDPATGQYTHPVAAFALAPDGRVTRVLSEVALNSVQLDNAIRDAAEGRTGDLIDRIALLCHGLSLVGGRNNAAVLTGLRIGGAATLFALAGGLGLLITRRRRVA
ncbi:SCO family protein [Caulobacter sp. S45]|jgi:protein SCO1/2|uniref:SCO family protein n=1 Tax=Caulobacter sp. S45 TaxID=1641861 RepID=UPI00131E40C1|nr:SCO family protein [Caulobacter sp. S45]